MRSLFPYLLPLLLFLAVIGVGWLWGNVQGSGPEVFPTLLTIIMHLAAAYWLWFNHRQREALWTLMGLIFLRLLIKELPIWGSTLTSLRPFYTLATVDLLLVGTYLYRVVSRGKFAWLSAIKWSLITLYLLLENGSWYLELQIHGPEDGLINLVQRLPAGWYVGARILSTLALLVFLCLHVYDRWKHGGWTELEEADDLIQQIGAQEEGSSSG